MFYDEIITCHGAAKVSCHESFVLYGSYHFIAISTSYLNAAGFLDSFFSACNITDRVYRGWAGRRGVG